MELTIHSMLLVAIHGIIFSACANKVIRERNHSSNISVQMAKDTTIEKFINQLTSPDPAIRQEAVTNLIQQGQKAVPALTELMSISSAPARDLVMEVLANIGDTTSASLFLTSLKDQNARVRAMAAQGLVKIRHPYAIDALIATLHDYGDETSPFTTSAYGLIDYGAEALPKVVLLLTNPSIYTREMGYRILAQIVTKIPEYRYKWKELDSQLGAYDPAASPDKREAAALKWKQWVELISKK